MRTIYVVNFSNHSRFTTAPVDSWPPQRYELKPIAVQSAVHSWVPIINVIEDHQNGYAKRTSSHRIGNLLDEKEKKMIARMNTLTDSRLSDKGALAVNCVHPRLSFTLFWPWCFVPNVITRFGREVRVISWPHWRFNSHRIVCYSDALSEKRKVQFSIGLLLFFAPFKMDLFSSFERWTIMGTRMINND